MGTAVVHYQGWLITVRITKIESKDAPAEYDAIAVLEKFMLAEDPALAEREKNARRSFGVRGAYLSESHARIAALEAAKRAIDLLH